jgi:YfiH family protein
MMADVDGSTLQEVQGELVLRLVRGETVFTFAYGPQRRWLAPQERLERWLGQQSHELAAIRYCDQVHGASVVRVPPRAAGDAGGAASVGEADGLASDDRGLGLLVWSADCVPLLLGGGQAVAAIHAGWRGAAAGIVPAAVESLRRRHGVRPDELTAILGPAVGLCHYEVGSEVVGALAENGVPPCHWRHGERVDLRAFVSQQLLQLGLRPSRISSVGGCTACDPRLASYRRDGAAAGRQWSMVYRRPLSCPQAAATS